MTVRQTFGDDMFLRRHRGLGAPVVNQFVWQFGRHLAPAAVADFAAGLSAGSLGRRAVSSRVPGARGRWVPDDRVPPVSRADDPVDAEGLRSWIDEQAREDHDPATGPAWRLATTRLRDGGQAVSLTVAHAAADGSAMIDAATRALDRQDPLALPPTAGPVLLDDVRDAASQTAGVARWARDRLRTRVSRSGGTTEAASASPATVAGHPEAFDEDWTPSWVVADLDNAALSSAIDLGSGTLNSWFVAVVADLVLEIRGPATTDGHVTVALPMSQRTPSDLRANATRIARVVLEADQVRTTDLTAVRQACREAYAAVPAAREPVPLELVQMMPDRLLGLLPPAPMAAALASNVTSLPPGFCCIDGVTARSVWALAHQPGLPAAEVARSGGGLIAFATRSASTTSVSVIALDPARVPDRGHLTEVLTRRLTRWGAPGAPLVPEVS